MLMSKVCAYSQGGLVLEVQVREGCRRRTLVSEGCLTTSEYSRCTVYELWKLSETETARVMLKFQEGLGGESG